MKLTFLAAGSALVLLAGSSAPGQTLADVARAEEARRKSVKDAGKVYTNEDLKRESGAPADAQKPVSSPGAAAAAPAGQPAAEQAPQASSAQKEEEPRKDQAYWSGRMKQARDQLERSKLLLAALESRTNALNADFVNRDDPAQRAEIERDRQRNVAETDRVRKEIEQQTKAIAAIEEEARKAGVPAGWLR